MNEEARTLTSARHGAGDSWSEEGEEKYEEQEDHNRTQGRGKKKAKREEAGSAPRVGPNAWLTPQGHPGRGLGVEDERNPRR